MRRAQKTLMVMLLVLMSVASWGQTRTRITVYTAWDQDYFYLAAVVEKPLLKGAQTAPFSDLSKDDAVSFFLQPASTPAGQVRSEKSVQMSAGAAGAIQLYRGAKAVPLKGFEDFLKDPEGGLRPFKANVTRKGELDVPANGRNSYTVEFAMPWVELGGPPSVGTRMLFNVVARSAAQNSPPIVSLSDAVVTETDVQNPSKWSEIVFTDSAVREVPNAPRAKVCARIFTAKPLIDGEVSDGEWNGLTSFVLRESVGAASPEPAAAALPRTRPKLEVRPPSTPVQPIQPPAGFELQARRNLRFPRVTAARYRMDYQSDPRKSSAGPVLADMAGAVTAAAVPYEGIGPWWSHDRADWHRTQLEAARQAGIDVLLAEVSGSKADIARYVRRGLASLAAALRWLDIAGRETPGIALSLPIGTVRTEGDKPADIQTEIGREALVRTLVRLRAMIPTAHRFTIPTLPAAAEFVHLSGTKPNDLSTENALAIRKAYFAATGKDLLLSAQGDPKQLPGADAPMPDLGTRTAATAAGLIRTAVVGVGSRRPGEAPLTRFDADFSQFRLTMRSPEVLSADLVVIDNWNDVTRVGQISPTLFDGMELSDAVLAGSRLRAASAGQLRLVRSTLPLTAAPGTKLQVRFWLQNLSSVVWQPGRHAVWARFGSSAPQIVGNPAAPVAPGQYALVAGMVSMPAEAGTPALSMGVSPLRRPGELNMETETVITELPPIPLTAAPTHRVTLGQCDLPSLLETGGATSVKALLRNDGTEAWKIGTKVTARLWQVQGDTTTETPVEAADSSIPLDREVPAGTETLVEIPLATVSPTGRALAETGPEHHYSLRFEVNGAATSAEPIEIGDADFGVEFIADFTPASLPGEKRQPVKIGLRNRGSQTWRKEAVRIGYHWYYQDGTEAIWEDETTPLTNDIEPGGEIQDMLAWVTPPPYDGNYILVWDVKVGNQWVSAEPSVRPFETMVHRVEIVRGRLQFIDLSRSFNINAFTSADARGGGDLDGTGTTLPEEILPPFSGTDIAASRFGLPSSGVGLDSEKRISFRWGAHGEKARNAVAAQGQRIPLAEPHKGDIVRVVHLLVAVTSNNITGALQLEFEDNSRQYSSIPFSGWDQKPMFGEEIAYEVPYTHRRGSDTPGKPVKLFRIPLKVTEKRKLQALILPNLPGLKLLAVTLEK
jgi:hypothetical protein